MVLSPTSKPGQKKNIMRSTLVIFLTLFTLAAAPAEAKRKKKSRDTSVSCCVVLGIYQPRLTNTRSVNERFFTATAYTNSGR